MTRSDLHRGFIERFAIANSVSPVADSSFVDVEKSIRACLPKAYREFAQAYGAVRFHDGFKTLVAERIDLWDIRSFLSPTEMKESRRQYLAGGMRESLFGFASDWMGNLFCFDFADISKPVDEAAVWFFDHEFCVDSHLTQTFDQWIESYASLPEMSNPA